MYTENIRNLFKTGMEYERLWKPDVANRENGMLLTLITNLLTKPFGMLKWTISRWYFLEINTMPKKVLGLLVNTLQGATSHLYLNITTLLP